MNGRKYSKNRNSILMTFLLCSLKAEVINCEDDCVLYGSSVSAEGGFVASYPELRGCLTSGETAEAALKNAQDCKREWLAAALEDGYEIPEPAPDVKYTNH